MRVPTRSAGTRSGVNWVRLNWPRIVLASVFTVSVLARPGTPSTSRWPCASMATITRSRKRSWPTTTRLTSYRICSINWAVALSWWVVESIGPRLVVALVGLERRQPDGCRGVLDGNGKSDAQERAGRCGVQDGRDDA